MDKEGDGSEPLYSFGPNTWEINVTGCAQFDFMFKDCRGGNLIITAFLSRRGAGNNDRSKIGISRRSCEREPQKRNL